MRAAKLLVLLGGILGVVAFFTPLVSGSRGGQTLTLSAFQLFTGATALKAEVDRTTAVEGMTAADLSKAKQDLGDTLAEVKGVVLGCFIPGFILALVGLVAVIRGKLGRIGGLCAAILGVLTLAIWGLLTAGFGETGGEVEKGIAMWLLLGTGLLGVVGGLGALVSPDHGRAAPA